MSVALSKAELCAIVGGRSIADGSRLNFERVEYDSREIRGGELFVALKGAAGHGHQHVPSALERGAALCLVEDESVAKSSVFPERMVVVADTLRAFWSLAQWWRRELKIPVLAITGSVGKTTTKEVAAAILLRWAKGTYSQKSHNNHVGVPYTMCRIAREHRWAVLEMGMSNRGEISALTKLGEPNVGLITLIAPAHIENLGSLQGICDAKFELLEGIQSPGTIVLNADDELQRAKWGTLRDGDLTAKFFGHSADADARLENVHTFGLEGIEFDLHLGATHLPITMRVLGRHNAMAAAGAALACRALIPELTTDHIAKGLQDFTAPLMRLAIKPLRGGRKLIDDSYNANPASMTALLDLAQELKAEKLRIGLLLGDMLELGSGSADFHRQIGELAARIGPEFLIAVGPQAQAYVAAAEKLGIRAMDGGTPEAAAQVARKFEFDVLLVKASRGIGLDRAVKVFMERDSI